MPAIAQVPAVAMHAALQLTPAAIPADIRPNAAAEILLRSI